VSPADAPESLPLDDPRWLPMTDVSARLRQPLGGRHVAEHDINEALALGDLHCLCRYRTAYGAWGRQLVSFLCWDGHILHIWADGVMTIHPRRTAGPLTPRSATNGHQNNRRAGAFFPLPEISGVGIFYGWEPDLERRWPRVFPPAIPQSDNRPVEQEPSSSKPGSADAWIDKLHPNDWQLFTAGKIHQEAATHGCILTLRSFQRALSKRRRHRRRR